MGSTLTYRDAIVQTFNGIFLNVSLFLFLGEQTALNVEALPSMSLFLIVFLPICFLEGHLLLSMDNILFLESFGKKNKFVLYKKCPWLFFLFFNHRIIGQALLYLQEHEKENSKANYKKNSKANCELFYKTIMETQENELSDRYCTLNDFFKGVVLILLFDMIMSLCQLKYIYAVIFLCCLFLSYCRGIKYARLYVREKVKLN